MNGTLNCKMKERESDSRKRVKHKTTALGLHVNSLNDICYSAQLLNLITNVSLNPSLCRFCCDNLNRISSYVYIMCFEQWRRFFSISIFMWISCQRKKRNRKIFYRNFFETWFLWFFSTVFNTKFGLFGNFTLSEHLYTIKCVGKYQIFKMLKYLWKHEHYVPT